MGLGPAALGCAPLVAPGASPGLAQEWLRWDGNHEAAGLGPSPRAPSTWKGRNPWQSWHSLIQILGQAKTSR